MIFIGVVSMLKNGLNLVLALLFTFCSFAIYGANIYSYLWVSKNTGSGRLDYEGAGVKEIDTILAGVNTGTMTVNYVDCSTTANVRVYYSSTDQWIFVPKEIRVGSNITNINVSTPSGYVRKGDIQDHYAFKKDGPIIYNSVGGLGGCGSVGQSWPYNRDIPDVLIKVDISNLIVGNYTGNVDIKMAYGDYHGVYSTDITKFSDTLAFSKSYVSPLPFNIRIVNKCLFTPDTIEIEHGNLVVTSASNNKVTSPVIINCINDALLSLNLITLNPSTVSYQNGVGVSLGLGWDSLLSLSSLGREEQSDLSIPVSGGISNIIKINSVLKRNGMAGSGNLQGNAALRVTIN